MGDAAKRRTGSAADHHQANLGDRLGAVVSTSLGPMGLWELVIETDAVVVGSRQRLEDDHIQHARARGIEVVARRSGGGAVYLSSSTSLWIDLWFPAQTGVQPIDLARLFVGVGEAWATGLQGLGLVPTVQRGPGSKDPTRKNLAQRVCFADVGWGEVTVGGSKVVGLSQRRVRQGTRVQCLAELNGSGVQILDFVDTTPEERAIVEAHTAAVAEVSAREVARGLIEALLSL